MDIIDSLSNNTIKTKKVKVLLDLLKQNDNIFISGKSSSGKSVLIAQVIKEKLQEGSQYFWIDLQDTSIDFYKEFLNISMNTHHSSETIVVIDNIHNSPESVEIIYKNIDLIRKSNSNIKLIIIGWPHLNETINNIFANITIININSVDIIDELIHSELNQNLEEKYSDGIKHLANKDVLVATQIIKYVKSENVLPTKEIIGKIMFDIIVKNNIISADAIKILYYIAILGQFEIQTSYKFLESISKSGIDELIDFQIVKYNKNKQYCFLGHRSLNNQLVLYLEKTFMKDNKLYAVDVVSDYIMKADKNQIINIIERLDLNNIKLTNNKKILKTLWNTFSYLQEKLYTQLKDDITWNNNLYSSIQACNTLAYMEFDEKAKYQLEKEKEYIDGVCGLNDSNEFVKYLDSTEEIDITQIIKAMKEDDNLFSKNESHDKIDHDRFYKTYTIGMMLGFETIFNNNSEKINKYINLIREIQEEDGSFYPRRVPWVTARTIISLTKAGLNYQNSDIVRKACDWLLSEKNKNLSHGEWKSGTGYWNTNINVTLLCMEALVDAGFTIDNPKIQECIAYIKKEKNQIFIKNKELDAVMYVYNIIKLNYQLSDISEDLETICNWYTNKDILSDVHLLSSESNDESQKAATIIHYLIKIIYEILKKEITSLLISLKYESKEESKTNYIGIHGSFGSPYCNWFEWLYTTITEKCQEIIIPQFPTGSRQNYKNWSRILKEYLDIGIINENTIIIGHSIAPIFICNFIIENQIRVKRLIFVCGFNNVFSIAPEYDMVNSDMYTDHIERIHEYCDDIVCLYTDNDPYVPYEKEKEFADLVSDRRELIKGGGHLNAETGYVKFNELLKYL